MSDATEQACRLCLVAPSSGTAEDFLARLGEAAGAGDIASLIVPAGAPVDRACVALAQRHGIAVVWAGEQPPRGVDGVQVPAAEATTGKGRDIVGIDDIHTRHDAMTAAERDPDYLFFGRIAETDAESIDPATLDLAAWWASVAVVPGVVRGGRSLASVRQAADAGIEFVAVGAAVWDDPRGPADAVAGANALLAAEDLAA